MSAPLEQLLRDARIDLVLSRIEKDESVIKEIINHLDSDIRSVKFNAILVLGEVGQKSVDSLSKLRECLEDNDWSICREATRTMGKLGRIAKESIPQLSKMLEDNEESIRKEAAIALGSIGEPTNEAISGLIKALEDKSEMHKETYLHLLKRANYFRNTLVLLYISISLFAIAGLVGGITSGLTNFSFYLTVILTIAGIFCLATVAILLIKESTLSLEILKIHLKEIDIK